jgi:hypothetical protein
VPTDVRQTRSGEAAHVSGIADTFCKARRVGIELYVDVSDAVMARTQADAVGAVGTLRRKHAVSVAVKLYASRPRQSAATRFLDCQYA